VFIRDGKADVSFSPGKWFGSGLELNTSSFFPVWWKSRPFERLSKEQAISLEIPYGPCCLFS